MKIVDLGWCLGRITKENYLMIVSPGDSSNGFYDPAQQITLFRKQDVEALRDFLIENYPIEAKP